MCLEGAPIPIPRHAGTKTLRCALVLLSENTAHGPSCLACTIHGRCGRCVRIADGAFAVGSARTCDLPTSIIMPAVLARADAGALRVVIGILVEGDGVERVHITKYVATPSAVMSSCEIGEGPCAGCFIAER